MRVMIATDGTINPTQAATIASALAGGDPVIVYTAVEVPRGMLEDMRTAAGSSADDKAREMSVPYRTTQADNAPVSHWIGDDAAVESYVSRKVNDRTAALAAALDELGTDYTIVGEESENAAQMVIAAAMSNMAEVVCIGAHGLGRFEGLLGSLATKVARGAPCSVVIVR